MSAAPVDVRGPRFGAWVTTVVLAVVLLTAGSPFGTVLLALQAVVFVVGAVLGVRRAPYGVLFRRLLAPRLAPPTAFEDPEPPRFAQAVGTVFAVVGVLGFAVGWTPVGLAATALALAAAFLNAAFGFCLGCELYLLQRRATSRWRHPDPATTDPDTTSPTGKSATRRGVAA
ncbi:MAG: hypothetical protein QOC98_1909 [Frankiaceae bacterium]|nr:hypothetical protein [Frankiaceae bacterium]